MVFHRDGVGDGDLGPRRAEKSLPLVARFIDTIGVILLLLSCARLEASPESDSERYLRLLSDTTTAVDTLLAECQEIGDWALRGDCSLALARRGTSSGDALTWCRKIEAGMWRDECLFSAAESAAMRDRFELSRPR